MKKFFLNPIISTYLGLEFLIALAAACHHATYVPFLTEKGMNLWQINIINAFFMVVIFLAELPTGSFADNFGRHRSLTISFIFLFIGDLVYFFSASFLLFIAAEVILAIGATFASGASEAWMVDSLRVREEQGLQAKTFRWQPIFRTGGVIIGVVFGSYLGNFDLSWPWLASSVLTLITIFFSLRLKENYRESLMSKEKTGLTHQLHYAWHYGIRNYNLLLVMMFGAWLAFSVQAVNMQWTLIFKDDYGLTSLHLGYIFAASSVVISLGAKFSQKLSSSLKEKSAIILPQVITAAAIIICSQASSLNMMLVIFLLHNFGRGIIAPLLQDFINNRLQSATRATLLSLNSMFLKIGAFAGLIISGFIAEATSIRTTWLLSGLFLGLGIAIFLIAIRKKTKLSPLVT